MTADDFDPERWAHPSSLPRFDWDAAAEELCRLHNTSDFDKLAAILRPEPNAETVDRLARTVARSTVRRVGPVVVSWLATPSRWRLFVDRDGSVNISTPWGVLAVMTRRYWEGE